MRRPATAWYWSARRRSPGEATGRPSSVNPTAPALGKVDHLGQLGAFLALADRGEETDRNLRLVLRALDQRAEDGGGVHRRLSVRHREDGAVAARSSGLRAGRDVLLVLAARRPQVDVRIDEGRGAPRAPLPPEPGSIFVITPASMVRSSVSSIPSVGSTTRTPS